MCDCEKQIAEMRARVQYLEQLIFNENNMRSCDTCRYENLSSKSEVCEMCCGVGEGLFPEWRAKDE